MAEKKPRVKRKISKPPVTISLAHRYLLDLYAIAETFKNIHPELLKIRQDGDKFVGREAKRLTRRIKTLNNKTGKKSDLDMTKIIKLAHEFKSLLRQQGKSARSERTVINSLFVTLFSRYDAFIIDVIRHYYESTDLIQQSDRQLKYADLISFGATTAKDIKTRFIDEEIENLRSSRLRQLEFIEKLTQTDILDKLGPEIPTFIESSERRNLLVHHDGNITNRYKSILKSYNLPPLDTDKKKISIDYDYFQKIVGIFQKISIEVCFAINESRQKKKNIRQFILDDVIIESIKNKEYETALYALEILNGHGLEKEYYLINRALCHKRSGNSKELEKDLAGLDAIKKDSVFEVAVCLLKDQPNHALDIIKRQSKKRHLELLDMNITMPDNLIFEDFIQTDDYKKAVRSMRLKLRGAKFRPSAEA